MNQKGLAKILTLGFILAVLIAGISFGYVKYFINENNNINIVVNENMNANDNLNTSSSTSTIENWKVYKNDVYQIKYPLNWEYDEDVVNAYSIIRVTSFRPTTLKNDFVWGVWEYDITKTIDELASTFGDQFEDRQEERESMTIDSVKATKVTVTTPQYSDWIGILIFIRLEDRLIKISNGANLDDNFEQFISTFQLLSTEKNANNQLLEDYEIEVYTNIFTDENDYTWEWDARLIKNTNSSGSNIIVESIREKTGAVLEEYAFPSTGQNLYLKSYLPDTDNAGGKIWSYNVKTKNFNKLENINRVFDGWGSRIISPDKKKACYVVDEHMAGGTSGLDQDMYLLDLENDTAEIIISLTDNETFNSGWGALCSDYNISWLDNNTISYSVYNHNSGVEGNCGTSGAKTKIDQRKYNF